MKEKLRISLVIIVSLITYYLTTYPIEKVGQIIDRISKSSINSSELYKEVVLLFVVAFCLYIIFFFKEYLLFVGFYNTQHELSRKVLEKMYKQTSVFFKKVSIADTISIIMNDVNKYIASFHSYGLLCFVEGFIYNGYLTAIIYRKTGFKFTILLISPFIIQTIIFVFSRKKQSENYEKMTNSLDITINNTLESIKGVRVIRAYNMKKLIGKKFYENVQKYSDNFLNYILKYAIISPITLISQALSYSILIIYGFNLISKNIVTLGDLVSVSIIIPMLSWPYVALSEFLLKISEYKISNQRVNKILKSKDVVLEDGDINLDDFREIKFKDFSIKKGQTIGIVGKTGSGKSIFIKQLLRFFNIEDNKIMIDGICIKKYNVKSIRDKIGYVPQENMLFSRSIKDNILFYNPEKNLDKAIYITDLQTDLNEFKYGIDTIVGENGISLSGGQKQRIQIARALVKDPEILILDDSLSAVDANTESKILSRLYENRKNKTNIIVSHRISVIKNADLIIVLEKGRVVDKGTHENLLNHDSWYKKLNDYQNSMEGDFDE